MEDPSTGERVDSALKSTPDKESLRVGLAEQWSNR
jgi:hypothetical protein